MVTPSGKFFITDGRYIEQSKDQVKGFDRYIDMDTNLSIIQKNNLLRNGLKIAFEGDHVNYTLYDAIQKTVVLLKVDMLQKLNISVDYADADGD